MAKVKELKFDIDGIEYSYNINVNKDGLFKINLDWSVAEKLGLKTNLFESKDMSSMQHEIISAVVNYNESVKSYKLFIDVKYVASGYFSCEDWGNRKFEPGFFRHGETPVIGLDYNLIIQESMPGVEKSNYYEAKKVTDWIINKIDKGERVPVVEGYYLGSIQYSFHPKDTTIPYSIEAIETLDRAKSGIKNISEILFNVLSQDSKSIEATLNSSKLLN